MPQNRISFIPDQFYHVYNHGNGDENIFREPENYRFFLKKYTQHLSPITDTFAYCLLPNHFHLMIRVNSVESLIETFKEKYPSRDVPNLRGFENLEGLVLPD